MESKTFMNTRMKQQKKVYDYQKNSTLCSQVLAEAERYLRIGMNELEFFTILKDLIKSNPEIEGIWHPIVVKFDHSTLTPGVSHQPNERVTYNEIAIVDIGIIAGGVELDYAKTFGATKRAKELIDVTDIVMEKFKQLCIQNQELSPKQAFFDLCEIAKHHGFTQIAESAGHVLGVFPSMKSKVKIKASEEAKHFTPGSWMLEVHLSNGDIGSFKEELVFLL